MSILYLTNPIHRPLNIAVHEILVLFESPNKVMSHENDFVEYAADNVKHQHEVMQLDSGHILVDFITQFFETSNEQESSNKTLQKIVKIDKHIVYSEYEIQSFQIKNHSNIFWYPQQKSYKGYLNENVEPPRPL
ncbi:hypothetical protein [Aurantibacter sp.]|uniref:hypothetical protein n=1 Tax=Aurantibacter sp. TaxID=2807103 RepID=UPI003266EC60